MFTQAPPQVAARFKALAFRQSPVTVSPARQARAAALALTVRAIKPGVYRIGTCFIDLFRNTCTCKQARAARLKGKPYTCAHRLALWLAEGVQINDPDPAHYLKAAEIEAPEIIAIYCHAKLPAIYPPAPQGFRILEVRGDQVDLFNVATGTHATTSQGNISHLLPFYE